VTPVHPMFTGLARKYRIPTTLDPWYHYESSTREVSLDFPTEPVPLPSSAYGTSGGVMSAANGEMRVSLDPGNSTAYYLLTMSFPGALVNANDSILFENIRLGMSGQMGREVKTVRRLEYRGMTGAEYAAQVEQLGKLRIRYFRFGNHGVMLMASLPA